MKNAWADQKMEQVVGTLLQAGVILAGIVVLAGGILYLRQYGHNTANYGTFDGARAQVSSVAAVTVSAFQGDSRAIIQLGLLLLIATPVARVIFSVFGFWMERDRTYVLVTLIVLGILMYSLFGGAL